MILVHVVPTYWPALRYGGPIYSVHRLCVELVNRGHTVIVLTTNVDGPNNLPVYADKPVDIDGVKVYYFDASSSRKMYFSLRMFIKLYQLAKTVDFIHCHSLYRFPTTFSTYIARLKSVPYSISPRGTLSPTLMRKKSWISKWLWLIAFDRKNIFKANFIHVTSDFERENIKNFRFVDQGKIINIPNGVDIAGYEYIRFSGDGIDNLSPAYKNLLFIGRISWEKGLDRLIEALKDMPNVVLTIAGNDEDGFKAGLLDLADMLGVSDRVKFVGSVYGGEKDNLFKMASIVVLPSYSENFGISALEGMAHGLAVAVTPDVGLANIVREFGCGLVLPTSPKQIATCLMNLLSNPNQMGLMGAKGRQVAHDYFSWSGIAGQMEKAYIREVAKNKK